MISSILHFLTKSVNFSLLKHEDWCTTSPISCLILLVPDLLKSFVIPNFLIFYILCYVDQSLCICLQCPRFLKEMIFFILQVQILLPCYTTILNTQVIYTRSWESFLSPLLVNFFRKNS